MPIGMSLAIFSQNFGGALFLSFAQTTFNSGLTKYIPRSSPSEYVKIVIEAGATAIRQAVPTAFLPGVLEAYNKSINITFYLAAAAAAASFISCWGMGWKSIKPAEKVQGEV